MASITCAASWHRVGLMAAAPLRLHSTPPRPEQRGSLVSETLAQRRLEPGVGLRERLEELRDAVENVGQQLASQRGTGIVRREDFERNREAVQNTLRLTRSVRARMLIGTAASSPSESPMMSPVRVRSVASLSPGGGSPAPGADAEAAEVFAALPRSGSRAQLLAWQLAEEGFQAIPQRVCGRFGHGGEVDSECAVCCANFRGGQLQKVTPCGHRFHTRCLRQWLVGQLSGMCPICRAPIGGAALLA